MKPKKLTDEEMKDYCFWYFRNNFKGQAEAAEKYDCTVSFISAVSTRKKPPTRPMMDDMGLSKNTSTSWFLKVKK